MFLQTEKNKSHSLERERHTEPHYPPSLPSKVAKLSFWSQKVFNSMFWNVYAKTIFWFLTIFGLTNIKIKFLGQIFQKKCRQHFFLSEFAEFFSANFSKDSEKKKIQWKISIVMTGYEIHTLNILKIHTNYTILICTFRGQQIITSRFCIAKYTQNLRLGYSEICVQDTHYYTFTHTNYSIKLFISSKAATEPKLWRTYRREKLQWSGVHLFEGVACIGSRGCPIEDTPH